MKKYLLLLTIFALFALPVASLQAKSSRLYIASYLGLNTQTENDFAETPNSAAGSYELENSVSFAGALGLRLTPRWRVEGEISYRSNEFDSIDINGSGSFQAGGQVDSWLYMVNLYHDLDTRVWNFQPFLTAGVGFGLRDVNLEDTSGLLSSENDDSLDLVWQIGGGLKYRFSEDLYFTGDYRYLNSTELELDAYDLDYSSHEFRLGFQYDIPVKSINRLEKWR